MAVLSDREHFVYALEHVHNGRIYIGQSVNPRRRYAQHKRRPVTRMATDAAAATDFDATFRMTILAGPVSRLRANHMEKLFIAQCRATTALGYNITRAAPASTRQFWHLFRNNLLRTPAQTRRHTA